MSEQAPQQQLDDMSEFEAKETSHALPKGWLLLFWGLIAFGVVYWWRYTPSLGGWSQAQDLEGAAAGSGANLLATIAFTAIPTAVAVGLILAQRRKRRGEAGR